jgi:SAM-dependent methyltransferase
MSDQDREKWNRKHAKRGEPTEPSMVFRSLAPYLPSSGRALDLGGGSGRHALWLASRGMDVTLADISAVALAQARDRAQIRAVELTTVELDLDSQPIPSGPWDLIVTVLFLWRPLLAQLPQLLSPTGMFACVQPTQRNLERHTRPPCRFLLREGELPALVNGLRIMHYQEGWLEDGRHDAVLVAKRPLETDDEAIREDLDPASR